MRNIFILVTIFAFVGAMLGCSTKVEPITSPVQLPENFSQSGKEMLAGEWWLSLGDRDLNALMERALTENFDLRSAFARLTQSRAQARQAGAPLYPSIDLSTGRERRATRSLQTETVSTDDGDGEGRTETRSSFETDYTDNYDFGLSASFEIDLWGRIRSAKNAATLEYAASEQDLQTAAITLSGNVATTWYQIQEQAGQVSLLKSQTQTTSDTLRLIQYRFNQGFTSASDVLQQKQLLESRREELERAKAQLRSLEIALAVLLGETPENRAFASGNPLPGLPPLPATGLAASAISARPDVRSALYRVQAADQRVASAIADRYPRISLTAGYNTTSEEFSDLFDNWVANIAANLAAPIFDGGQRRAEVERTRAVALERFYDYGQVLLDALGEVEIALNNEARQHAVVASIARQLELARQVTESIRAEYLRGGAEYLRVLDAQISQQNLERELLTAKRQLIGFRIDLHRALAGGWELTEPENPRLADNNNETGNDGLVEKSTAEKIYPLPLPIPSK